MTALIVGLSMALLLVMIGQDALCVPITPATHGPSAVAQLCSIAVPRQPVMPTIAHQRRHNGTMRQSEGWPGVVRRPPRMLRRRRGPSAHSA